MSFLSSETLRLRLPSLIDPFRPESIRYAAYELRLGNEVFITTDGVKKMLKADEQIKIPPGQFALLLTEESVQVPDDLIAFISMRYGIKFRGLTNISGFHVDPGFKGRLKFSVYNAGSQAVVLSAGEPVFSIWYSKLDRKTKNVYNGSHQGQTQISEEDVMRLQGEIASPAVLKSQLDKLQSKVNYLITLGIALFVMVLKVVVFDPLVSLSHERATVERSSSKTGVISPSSSEPPIQPAIKNDSLFRDSDILKHKTLSTEKKK